MQHKWNLFGSVLISILISGHVAASGNDPDDTVTKNVGITGNTTGNYNIQGHVDGGNQQVPMQNVPPTPCCSPGTMPPSSPPESNPPVPPTTSTTSTPPVLPPSSTLIPSSPTVSIPGGTTNITITPPDPPPDDSSIGPNSPYEGAPGVEVPGNIYKANIPKRVEPPSNIPWWNFWTKPSRGMAKPIGQ